VPEQSAPSPMPPLPSRRHAPRLRRGAAVAIIVVQLLLVVRAYSADHAFFGFQMFPESSEWMATIEREIADGTRIDVREPWPGGYRWGDLVAGRGLDHPFSRRHADTGLDSTLHFFSEALDWVALHTPGDTETIRLVATVTTWHNGREPTIRTIAAERSR
jgi:hypothetical protein